MAKTAKTWILPSGGGFDSLEYIDAPIPALGDKEVLVKFHAASLNFRDLLIAKGRYLRPARPNVVMGSDGAGVVAAVGKDVRRFATGDRVMVLFNQGHLAGAIDGPAMLTGVGAEVDGCLREYGAFDEHGLVAMPGPLSFVEAATLGCAGLTAWNALYGLGGRRLTPGDWVLTQGTGGVSVFALQFAKAAGAKVVATTSSAAKAARLRQLGADHVINYKEDAAWGPTAKALTGGRGFQHIVEVGGPNTLQQSFAAVAYEGVISIIGALAGHKAENPPAFLECVVRVATVRGVFVGSRLQFEEMNRAIEANNIKPVVDEKLFKLDQVKEAFQYMWDQKHFGKLCIEID